MQAPINRQVNLFSVEIEKNKNENDFSTKIGTVITTKIKPNSVGSENLKSQLEYNKEDAEVWVFVAGGAPLN